MRVTVNIPDPLGEEVVDAAREEGVSVSALYARAVERYLQARLRERAIARVDALIGSAPVAPGALDELERERAASERRIG
jgi:metal-responsive CopG/Arc/MetJ family transcriptional regulator